MAGGDMTDGADRIYEQVLLLRCQAGDGGAFAELIERYGPRVRYYLRQMLGDAHAAEDVLQDVWLDVFQGVPKLLDLAAFPAWVYRVAHDRAARVLRRPPPPEPLPAAEFAGPDAARDFSPDDAAQIHAALNQLPPDHREILVLRFLEEMSYEDIARVVGSPVGTVRSRLHYAKRALRLILERTAEHERK
jgi:RNA polymerase sigma-70 factor (ECF subfamily)